VNKLFHVAEKKTSTYNIAEPMGGWGPPAHCPLPKNSTPASAIRALLTPPQLSPHFHLGSDATDYTGRKSPTPSNELRKSDSA